MGGRVKVPFGRIVQFRNALQRIQVMVNTRSTREGSYLLFSVRVNRSPSRDINGTGSVVISSIATQLFV